MHTNENKIKYIVLFLCTLSVLTMLIACADNGDKKKPSIANGVDIAVMPTTKLTTGKDTSDEKGTVRGVILDINAEKSTIILQHIGTQDKSVYTYTGGTDIVNRYDEVMSDSQLTIGEIVDIKIGSNGNKLTKIKVSDKEWEYKGATELKIDKDNQIVSVGSNKYFYTENTVIVNEGKIVGIDTLESIDVVTLKGNDKQLDSIIVTESHGYVRLDSTTFFEGGFVEIGPRIVKLITENMVIPVPTGTYNFSVTKDKTSGSREITVSNNEEIRIDLTEFQSDAVRLGTLSFKISPAGAKLMIDGVAKDYSGLVDVAYGTHKIVISAEGYEPYSQIITVEDIFKEFNISLVRAEETENTTSDENSKTDSTTVKEENNSTKYTEKETTTMQTIDYESLMDSLFGN